MTWEWSHGTEAYHNVRQNIAAKDREWLEIVYAEWTAQDGNHLAELVYDAALAHAKTLPGDALADFVYDKASELSNCTNGGWEAHYCPFGCGCHMVPFDRETEDEPEE